MLVSTVRETGEIFSMAGNPLERFVFDPTSFPVVEKSNWQVAFDSSINPVLI